jgi:hypothetical protein
MATFTKAFIALNVLVFVGFGLSYIIAPQYFAAPVEIEVRTPTALADFRAIYGGLSLSVGLFFALGLFRPAMVLPALWLIAGSSLALALSRVYSTLASGVPGPQIFLFTGLELVAFAIGAWLYARESRAAGAALRRPMGAH